MSQVKNIAIDMQPWCAPPVSPEAAVPNAWLANSAIQSTLYTLDAELKPFEAALVGVTFDHPKQTAVVVFHTTFRDYEAVRGRLLGKVEPLAVALRPACHSTEQIAEAKAVLERRDWHPRAASVSLSYFLDAAFSGFTVVVDAKAPEVADALKQRLGELVRVSLGSPQRTAQKT